MLAGCRKQPGLLAKAARLAPDRSSLAFLSDRAEAEVFQLYLLDEGQLGEARPALSQLVIYPGEGHGVRRFPAVTDHLTRLVMWFEKYMPT